MRSIMSFAALALTAAIFVPRYAEKAHLGQSTPTLMAAQSASQTAPASPADSRSVILSRIRDIPDYPQPLLHGVSWQRHRTPKTR